MRFFQVTCAQGYEDVQFADRSDTDRIRDLGPQPQSATDWVPPELVPDPFDERGRPLRPATVMTPSRPSLTFRPQDRSRVEPYLSNWGEILAATMSGQSMLLFHCTTYADVFDLDRSNTSKPAKILPTTTVVFRPEAEELDILTVSTHPTYGMFFSEKAVDSMRSDNDLFAGLTFIAVAETP
ncbi:hypothetical protein [Nocardia sp. BMG51109]|uniref:hypothetical protein n=1 Tax=Nocardia sp. BMG51109 TaxID=1056816 RepID=UPI0004665332|nr:hypothetical protein [Nocardia sp. BMG51109]